MSALKKKKIPTIEDVMYLTPSDFEANEAGKLSPMQTRRLQSRRMMWGLASLGALAMLLLLVVSVVVLLGLGTGEEGGMFVAFAFVGLLWAVLLAQMPLKWWRANQELASGEVTSSTGRIIQNMSTVPVGMIHPTRYYIEQGDHKFEVDKKVFFAFKNGEPYTLYYTPKTKLLVGAHHITADNYFVPEADDESDTWEMVQQQRQQARQNH